MPSTLSTLVPGSARGARVWRFAHAELDERAIELRIHGEPVALEPKLMVVLRHLLENAGEAVSKDQLADRCWPKRIYSDSVLTKAISRLRDVLQDHDQRIVVTVHGHGYRLAAPVAVTLRAAQPALLLDFV